MDTVLFLRQASDFQSMEMERVEVICGLETSPQSRLWPTRGGCACKQEVAFFGLRLAGTKMACLEPIQRNVFLVPHLLASRRS